jgi:hypothetical protein
MFNHTISPQERAMRTLIGAAAFAGLLALSGVSQAAQIASPTIYGTFDQVVAECSVVNACVATASSLANFRGGLVFHKHVQDDLGILVLHPIRFAPLR